MLKNLRVSDRDCDMDVLPVSKILTRIGKNIQISHLIFIVYASLLLKAPLVNFQVNPHCQRSRGSKYPFSPDLNDCPWVSEDDEPTKDIVNSK